jgi:hypothetical protein
MWGLCVCVSADGFCVCVHTRALGPCARKYVIVSTHKLRTVAGPTALHVLLLHVYMCIDTDMCDLYVCM